VEILNFKIGAIAECIKSGGLGIDRTLKVFIQDGRRRIRTEQPDFTNRFCNGGKGGLKN
jgi:hypothetical protein